MHALEEPALNSVSRQDRCKVPIAGSFTNPTGHLIRDCVVLTAEGARFRDIGRKLVASDTECIPDVNDPQFIERIDERGDSVSIQ